jgi:DNA-directed RNA polymerase I subunit RPA49
MYKNLGCSITLLSPEDRSKLGITMDEARLNRKAVMKAPVVYPKPKTRGPVKR